MVKPATRLARGLAAIVFVAAGFTVSARLLAARIGLPHQATAVRCETIDDSTASSVRSNCMTLVPVPDFPNARATIQLRPVPGPFGVTVHADGRPRYRLWRRSAAYPMPRSLGSYSVYVAWAYTLSLDSAVKLGSVKNGAWTSARSPCRSSGFS